MLLGICRRSSTYSSHMCMIWVKYTWCLNEIRVHLAVGPAVCMWWSSWRRLNLYVSCVWCGAVSFVNNAAFLQSRCGQKICVSVSSISDTICLYRVRWQGISKAQPRDLGPVEPRINQIIPVKHTRWLGWGRSRTEERSRRCREGLLLTALTSSILQP